MNEKLIGFKRDTRKRKMSLKKEMEQEKEKEKIVVIFGKVFVFRPAPFGTKAAPIVQAAKENK